MAAKRTVTYDGQSYKVRKDSIVIPDLDAMERRVAVVLHQRGVNVTSSELARLTETRLHIKELRAKQLGLNASTKIDIEGGSESIIRVITLTDTPPILDDGD